MEVAHTYEAISRSLAFHEVVAEVSLDDMKKGQPTMMGLS